MSSSMPFTTQSEAGASKCFRWRKRGSNKIRWWVISGKCLQDKYQKYNFIGEDCKAKCAKTWQLVQNVKSVTTSTFESKLFLHIGFIVKTWCSMSSVGSTPEMSRLWNFSVRVQSWSDEIESDPVLIHKIIENHQSDPVLIHQHKNVFLFCLRRQNNYWSYIAFNQIRLVEGKIFPGVLLPHDGK